LSQTPALGGQYVDRQIPKQPPPNAYERFHQRCASGPDGSAY
jgi:hypothetical protein